MPKLTAVQWIIVAVFQVFYGFAVFALTRDHFQRRPGVPAVIGANPHATAGPRAQAPERELPSIVPPPSVVSAIPESVAQKDPLLLAELGDERFRQRQYGDAIGIYRRVLEMNPDDVDTRNDLGLALHYSGDSTQALQVLKQGAEKDPGFQRIWLTLGFVQMHTAERAEARFALQEALALGPNTQVGQEAKRLLANLDAGQ